MIAPSRNGLSHTNKERDAAFMEKLFWEQLEHLRYINPSFAIVDTAAHHDNKRARELCADLKAGESSGAR